MSNRWFHKVKIGDKLNPVSLWNSTERGNDNKLPETVEVLEVIKAHNCQSGVLFRVRTIGGMCRDLDAAWFEGKA